MDNIVDKLYEIFETFTDQLIDYGWKGVRYGWKDTERWENGKGGWCLFELDNGFKLRLEDPEESENESGDKKVSLCYWFEGGEPIEVDSLDQLLDLLL